MRRYSVEKPLISLHIPKCAGQSFRETLHRWFGDRLFFHYFQQHNAMPPRRDFSPGICIHGHFNRTKGFGVMDYYPEADQFITILRNPLDMAISNYFYWKNKARANQIKAGKLTEGDEHDYKDIDDFFMKRPKSHMLDFMPWELTADNYKETLETAFVWVGFTENLQESIDELARLLGFSTVQIGRINVSSRDEDLSPTVRDTFLADSAFEFEVYDYARQVVNR